MTSDGTVFSQINLQHCKAATDLLQRRITVMHTDIFLIQEPRIHMGHVGGLKSNWGTVIQDTTVAGPRACLLINKKLNAVGLRSHCSRDLAAALIKIKLNGHITKLVVCSAYLPYDAEEPPPTKELRALVQDCRTQGLQLVIGCDANSHNTLWGSSDCNRRGIALLEFLSAHHLEIMNRGNRPTFVTSRRQEVIDITLGTAKVAQTTKNWRVSDEITLSDHRLISFRLEGEACDVPTGPYRNPRACDWSLYKEELDTRLGGLYVRPKTTTETECAVADIQSAVTQSYELACPAKSRKSSKKVPWWSNELNKTRSKTRKLLNRAMKVNSEDAWSTYRESQKDFKRLIKSSKRAACRSFCEETEAVPFVARLRKVFTNGPLTTSIKDITLPDRKIGDDSTPLLEHLLEVHFPGSTPLGQGQPTTSAGTRNNMGDRWEVASKVFTKERVLWALQSFGRYKSPGLDGILPAMLQEGASILADRLKEVFLENGQSSLHS
ncbi:uncharacterized protein LOC143213650 [Lasioglossum baleicum]|uniref:uncharacterized protein LOC143213650 n=1 Tax=Lasioglossum baleicum TaxID=434251 RepID=UPI003FCE33D9